MRTTTGPMAELIDCVATGRVPTVYELGRVAERVWVECAAGRGGVSWRQMHLVSEERAAAYRAAHAAMCGST